MSVKGLILRAIVSIGIVVYAIFKLAEYWYYDNVTDTWVFGWCEGSLLVLRTIGIVTLILLIRFFNPAAAMPPRSGWGIPMKGAPPHRSNFLDEEKW